MQPYALSFDSRSNFYVMDLAAAQVLELQTNTADFHTVATGQSSAPITVTFRLNGHGNLGPTPYKVLTQGAPGLDFSIADNSTCNNTTTYGTMLSGDVASCQVNVVFTPTAAGARNGAVELFDSNGNVIATAYIYGVGQGPQMTYMSSATPVSIGSNLQGSTAVAVDGNGNVFLISGSSIQKVTPDGNSTTLDVSVTSPSGLALDGAGNLYVTDRSTNTVNILSAISGFTSVRSVGTGLSAPTGITVDGAGNIFIADFGSNSLKEITTASGYGATVTLPSVVSRPVGITLDSAGNIFATDNSSAHVQEFTAASGYASAITIGSDYSAPQGVAVDAAGDVYVADLGVGEIITSHPLNNYQNQTGVSVTNPVGVAVDSKGNLYFASPSSMAGEFPLGRIPALGFPTPTTVGTTDTVDPPQVVSIANIGNDTLTFTTPADALSNPSFPANFQGQGNCLPSQPLTPGQSCMVAVIFAPTEGGDIAGSVVFRDITSIPLPRPSSSP